MLTFPVCSKMQKAKSIGSYTISPSFKCNWHCSYCIVKTHEQEEPDFEKIKKEVQDIPNGAFVSISGGEPGLVSSEKLDWLFEKLLEKQCYIHIITNGEFFKRTEYLESVDHFAWHCTENLEGPLRFPDINPNKIEFILVLTDKTYKKLGNYMGKYPVVFNIRGADNNGRDKLSLKNAVEVYNKYKDQMTIHSMLGLITRFSKYEKSTFIQ